MSTVNNKQICELLDKLTIEMMDLMEQKVRCEINIEKQTNEGKLLLAKTRYIQGSHSVTKNQLPTEDSDEFNALLKVSEIDSTANLAVKKFGLKRHFVDKKTYHIDPTKWFGVLVPRSLQFAKERFNIAMESVIECANIHCELQTVIAFLNKLTYLKRNYK